MALTELQLPSKDEFYANLQQFFTNWNRMMQKATDLQEFLGSTGTADLDAMGVPTGQIRTDLIDARTVINESLAFHNGTSTSQTVVPAEVLDKIRRMS